MSNVIGTYEMLWDCRFCGTKKLLGKTHRHCPNCGAAQDPNLRYFPSEAEAIAVEDHVYHGADIVCSYCKAATSAKAKFCGECGAPLTEGKAVQTRAAQEQAEGAAFAGETAADAKRERETWKQAMHGKPPGAAAAVAGAGGDVKIPKRGGGKLWVFLGVGAVIVAVVAAVFLWKRPAGVVVTGHAWEREIHIEGFGPQRDSAWCDQMPHDARRVHRHREVRSHDEVPDGEECTVKRVDNGDGTFRKEKSCKKKYRKEPVYADKCDYEVDRWHRVRTVKSSGSGTSPEPSWPEAHVRSGVGNCVGCERLGGRDERYVLQLARSDKQEALTCTVDEAKWRRVPKGSRWEVDVGVISGSADCSTMRPK